MQANAIKLESQFIKPAAKRLSDGGSCDSPPIAENPQDQAPIILAGC
jgi:hypothetical protein